MRTNLLVPDVTSWFVFFSPWKQSLLSPDHGSGSIPRRGARRGYLPRSWEPAHAPHQQRDEEQRGNKTKEQRTSVSLTCSPMWERNAATDSVNGSLGRLLKCQEIIVYNRLMVLYWSGSDDSGRPQWAC